MSLEVEEIVQVIMQQRDRLYARIWAIVGDAQLAEDALQELALLAVDKGRAVTDLPRLEVWLQRAARLKALEMLRSRRQTPLVLDAGAIEEFWNGPEAVNDERQLQALRDCLQHLTPQNRRILTLRYADGQKSAAIAATLGREVESVYKALFRIHRALRNCVQTKLAREGDHD